jgi:hypothetical protein
MDFWRILHLHDNKGKTIAQSLADVVAELTDKCFTICSVVTDNAANEVLAVRELAKNTQQPIVRIPCISHTINLAVQDFFKDIFGKDVFPGHLRVLYNALPTKSEGDAFYGLDSICASRWLSFGRFVERIVKNSNIAHSLLKRGTHPGDVLRLYFFPDLDACFRVVNSFMTITESEKTYLDSVFVLALDTIAKLSTLAARGNRYAAGFIKAVRTRLTTTADLGQLLLGYLITRRGLEWYRHLDADGGPVDNFTQKSVRAQIDEFLKHFIRLFQVDQGGFFLAFDIYLTILKWPADQPGEAFWKWVWTLPSTEHSTAMACYQWIAIMALIVMRMPCSEAAVERLFSRMRQIVNKRSRRIRRDLLEARLILQMNRGKMDRQLRSVLKKFEEEEDARPVKMQQPPSVVESVAPISAGSEFPIPLISAPPRTVPEDPVARLVPVTLGMTPISKPVDQIMRPGRLSVEPVKRTVDRNNRRKAETPPV